MFSNSESSCRNDPCDGYGYDYMINYSEFIDAGTLRSASLLLDNNDIIWIINFATASISSR
ncbi:MAG: hypothetical protein R6W70_02920 [bacterium]